jgi:hypothetical protein
MTTTKINLNQADFAAYLQSLPGYTGTGSKILADNLTWVTETQTALEAPTLAVDTVTATSISLSWNTPTNATGFVLQRALNSGFTSGLATIYTGAAESFNDTGLAVSTPYYYRIKATASGYADSTYGTANDTTSAGSKILAAPAIDCAVDSTTSILVTWLPVSNATSYTLERATDNIFTQNLTSVYTGSNTTYTDTGRTTGTVYYYRIKASATNFTDSTHGISAGMAGTISNITMSGSLTIDGSVTTYPPGTIITIAAGFFQNGVDISNVENITIDGTGLVLDGDLPGNTGFYNCLSATNCNNVIIKGVKTQNNGYHAGYVSERNSNLVFQNMIYDNCAQGVLYQVSTPLIWDETDNTVAALNHSWINGSYNACGGISLGGNISGTDVINLTKNLVYAGNTYTDSNPDNIIYCAACDYYDIYNNNCDSINLAITNDSRLFLLSGYGDFHHNIITNIWGHSAACWSVAFGSTVQESHYHDNICIGSLKYSSFEFQEFANFVTPHTTKANLLLDFNSCGKLNSGMHTEFPSNVIDDYGGQHLGGDVAINNNLLWEVGYDPTVPEGGNFANINGPLPTQSGNLYFATQNLAIDAYYNSLHTGVGANED